MPFEEGSFDGSDELEVAQCWPILRRLPVACCTEKIALRTGDRLVRVDAGVTDFFFGGGDLVWAEGRRRRGGGDCGRRRGVRGQFGDTESDRRGREQDGNGEHGPHSDPGRATRLGRRWLRGGRRRLRWRVGRWRHD